MAYQHFFAALTAFCIPTFVTEQFTIMPFRAIDTAKCVTQSDDHHGHRGHRGHRGHHGHHGCQGRHGLHVRGDRHIQIFICEGQLSQFLRCFPNGLSHANARHNVVFISGVVYNEDASVMAQAGLGLSA